MTLEEYLKEHKQEKMCCDGGLQVKDIDVDERSVTAVISTDTIDRDREILLPKGADIEAFIKNPVVPWSHNSGEPPIGKALWIKRGRKKLTAKVKFATTERAEEVWQLFKQGFLKAFSVGFIPKEGHAPTPDEIKKKPEWAEARYIFDKWELLEFSPVTVPANPDALATAIKSKEIKLSDDMKKELDIEEDETFIIEEEEKDVDLGDTVVMKVKDKIKVKKKELPDVDIKPNQPDIKTVPSIEFVSKENYETIQTSNRIKGKMY